jgi:hypothetical protein
LLSGLMVNILWAMFPGTAAFAGPQGVSDDSLRREAFSRETSWRAEQE